MSKAVVISHPLLPERNAEKELGEKVARVEAAHIETLNAAQLWRLSDEELEAAELPEHVKRVAREARKPKSEAAVGLIMAHEFVIAREKSRATLGAGNKVNINVSGNANVGVVAPPRQEAVDESDVVEIVKRDKP